MDIAPLQQLTPEILTRDAHLFTPKPAIRFNVDITRNTGASGARRFTAPNPYSHLLEEGDSGDLAPPGASFYYYLRTAASQPPKILVEDQRGAVIRELDAPAAAGINRIDWNLRGTDLPPLPAWQRVGGNDSNRLSEQAARGRPGPLVAPGEYRVTLVIGAIRESATLRVETDGASRVPKPSALVMPPARPATSHTQHSPTAIPSAPPAGSPCSWRRSATSSCPLPSIWPAF